MREKAEEHEVLTSQETSALLRMSTKAVLLLARKSSLPKEKEEESLVFSP